ncbi:hypothetical protein [Conchiformibius steedae]|nr:hypothetical protein [Conchiformibius steedae]
MAGKTELGCLCRFKSFLGAENAKKRPNVRMASGVVGELNQNPF